MRIGRTSLLSFITKELKKLTESKNEAKQNSDSFIKEMNKNYNYPTDKSVLIMSHKTALETLSNNELFWIVETIDPSSVEKYFDTEEIATYSKSKYNIKPFDIGKISCVEVVKETQWIGVLEDAASFFLELRKHNMINYNPDAQREMTIKKLRDGQSIYSISLDKRALESMRQRYKAGNFISNTITLNIDPYGETVVNYDYNEKTISFENLTHFDIIDGFHRYRALCAEKDDNPNFSYPMEIRFTKFGESKASDFIYQEGQKVPMKKTTLDSFDVNSVENKIIKYMTEELAGFLAKKNIVGRSNSYILLADLSAGIKDIYVSEDKHRIKNDSTSYIKETAKEISSGFNKFEDLDVTCFGEKLSPRVVYSILFCIRYNVEPTEDWLSIAKEFDNKMKRKTITMQSRKLFRETIRDIADSVTKKERR